MRVRAAAVTGLIFLAALGAPPARATQVRVFQTQGAAGFLGGKLASASVDALGRLRLAPRAVRLATVAEPFLFCAAPVPGHGRDVGDAWVAGTGNSGKVLLVRADGSVEELFAAPEPEVFAVWADADGTVFAGTSPHGKVYRIPVPASGGAKGKAPGKATVFFDPGETYIWALARDAAGRLLVATGTQGKLFRVDAQGHGEVLLTVPDAHVRSLAFLPGGDLLVGTAGRGLILRLAAGGRAQTLFQADEPEVAALAVGPDGSAYASADASEASLVDLGRADSGAAGGPPGGGAAPAGGGAGGKPAGGRPAKAAAVPEEAGEGAFAGFGSRRANATGPRSELLRIAPDGRVETLWTFTLDTVFGLRWQQDRLWVATGPDGKLYSYAGGRMEMDEELDDRQIVALLPGDAGPALATTNGAAFYRLAAGTERRGTYTSAPLDAGLLARFGSFRWRGELPAGAHVHFALRSGMSALPDDSWSPWWTPPGQSGEPDAAGDGAGALGGELPLGELPRGRFVQWRVELRAGGGAGAPSPVLYSTELSYRQENLAPRITALSALDPGQILVPVSFNPSNQVYEPAHPNREGIFVPVGTPSGDDLGAGRTKPLWKAGFQTLRWTANDPNEDTLVYDLDFRPATAPDTDPWLKVAADLEEDHYSFDATVLPDGLYRFRLTASDRLSNDPSAALSTQRISDPVLIDHAPPVLAGVERAGGKLRVTVHDAWSPIREAVWSVDAAAWKPAATAGLLDGQTLTVVIDAAEAARGKLLLLRVTDAAYNVVTFDLTGKR